VAAGRRLVFKAEVLLLILPLPLALGHIVGTGASLPTIVAVGLFGLIASFHGLMLAAGRSTLNSGGWACSRVSRKSAPPLSNSANALLVNMFLGIIALLTERLQKLYDLGFLER